MKIKHFHNFSFLRRFMLVGAIKIDKVLSPHCKGGKKLTIVNLDKTVRKCEKCPAYAGKYISVRPSAPWLESPVIMSGPEPEPGPGASVTSSDPGQLSNGALTAQTQ